MIKCHQTKLKLTNVYQDEALQSMQGMETYHSTNTWSMSEITLDVEEVVIQEMRETRTEPVDEEMSESQQPVICEAVSTENITEQVIICVCWLTF